MGRTVSAIKIKKLYYADALSEAPTLTKAGVTAAIATANEIGNSHQGTFQYEETEPTVNKYKNGLTKQVYRSDMEAGDVTISFSIGAYDFATKAELQGGASTETSWTRGTSAQMYKCFYAITEDDVCIIFPKANIIASGKTEDNAIAIGMKAVAQEVSSSVASEYWVDVQ